MTSLTKAEYEARRRDAMTKLRARGWTYQRIADKYGITRQRAHQILKGAKP